MAYLSLYRRFRPSTFDAVVGQEHITKTIINQIKSDKISHAYLFTGTRGTGKTSTAKIFAKACNCLSPVNGSPCLKCDNCIALSNPNNMDVLELDAASNNSVDDIRALKDGIEFKPAIGKYKVYIIDEVHMLSASAYNALLKTLEEPPSHVIFILATTEAHKLPDTILSRCIRFDFRLVPVVTLVNLLGNIFNEIGYPFDSIALTEIALAGQGSVRDTLSVADMCMSFSPEKLTLSAVLDVLGASEFSTIFDLANAVLSSNVGTIVVTLRDINNLGKGIGSIHKALLNYFRDLIAIKNVSGYSGNLSIEQLEISSALAETYDNYYLARTLETLSKLEADLRYSSNPSLLLEATLIKASQHIADDSHEGINTRIRELEKRLKDIDLQALGQSIIQAKAKPSEASQSTIPTAESDLSNVQITEEKPVFEEDYALALERGSLLLPQIIAKAEEMRSAVLASVLKKIVGILIEGNNITFLPNSAQSKGYLMLEGSFSALCAYINDILGEGYNIKIEDKEASLSKSDNKVALINLFQNKLK